MKALRIGQTDILIEPVRLQIEPPAGLAPPPPAEGDRIAQPSGLGDAIASRKEITDMVTTLAREFDNGLQSMIDDSQIKEITVEFSLSITAETNFWVIKSTGEGSFKVGMKWER